MTLKALFVSHLKLNLLCQSQCNININCKCRIFSCLPYFWLQKWNGESKFTIALDAVRSPDEVFRLQARTEMCSYLHGIAFRPNHKKSTQTQKLYSLKDWLGQGAGRACYDTARRSQIIFRWHREWRNKFNSESDSNYAFKVTSTPLWSFGSNITTLERCSEKKTCLLSWFYRV